MVTTWTIEIDWERDGSYTDETDKVLSANWLLVSSSLSRLWAMMHN